MTSHLNRLDETVQMRDHKVLTLEVTTYSFNEKISNKNDFASFVLFVLYMNASDCEHFCLWEFPKTQFILRSDLRFQSLVTTRSYKLMVK